MSGFSLMKSNTDSLFMAGSFVLRWMCVVWRSEGVTFDYFAPP